jgi:charged multivesicular body protein 3
MFNSVLEHVGLKEVDHKAKMREWQNKLKKESRAIDRQLAEIAREEKKQEADIRKLAKQGNQDAAVRILAKNIVQSRKATNQLYNAKANLNSVGMQMKQMSAQATMGKMIKASGDTMRAMNQLMNIPKLSENMKEMSREMEKAGFLSEMMDDMMPGQDEDVDIVDEEVAKVIAEATMEKLSHAPVVTRRVPVEVEAEEEEEEDDEETKNLEQRLKNLS